MNEKDEKDERDLIASSKKAQMQVFDAQIGVHKAWIEVDELNKKLVEAGLAKEVLRCW